MPSSCHVKALLCLVLGMGCRPVNPCELQAGVESGLAILDPPPEVVSYRGWWPWVVAMDRELVRGRLVACVDGVVQHDPSAITRPGREAALQGYQHIRTLDIQDWADGAHELLVLVDDVAGGPFFTRQTVEAKMGTHRLEVRVVEPSGAPTSARVIVTRDGSPVTLDPGASSLDPYGRDHGAHAVFVTPESPGVLRLEAGRYRFVAARDVRDHLGAAVVDVPAERGVELVVSRAVEDERLAADLHVHTARSFDSLVPEPVRLRSLAAAGLDVAVVTDHGKVPRAIREVDSTTVMPGTETDVRDPDGQEGRDWDWAHINAFPLTGTQDLPDGRTPSIGALLDAYRLRQQLHPFPGADDAVVLQLNHPRGIQFLPGGRAFRGAWPMFNTLGFDPYLPVGEEGNAWLVEQEPGTGTTALDLDAMEVFNRFSFELFLEVREDWHALWNQGYRITGTGNSDSHGTQVELVGLPVNLVDAPRPSGEAGLNVSAWVDAIQRGAVSVSTGPVVSMWVIGSSGRRVPVGNGPAVNAVEVEVRVQAAPWVPVEEVRLIVNGEVIERVVLPSRASTETLDWVQRWPLNLEQDGWVSAEAGWPLDGALSPVALPSGDYALVAPGYLPVGFTNPVPIDLAGDGWQSPGLGL